MIIPDINIIFEQNKDKNFIQRAMNPTAQPYLEEGTNKMSHQMSYVSMGDKYIVYPKIIQDPRTQKLRRLQREEALHYAIKNKQYVEFPDERQAAWFLKHYKDNWPK